MSDSQNLVRSSGKIGILTFLSRILGFVRDILMAALFGTSMVADAFNLAFTIPNLFRRLFGEGSLNAAFIPVYTEHLQQDREKAQYLVHNIMSVLVVVLCVLVGIGVMTAPWLLKVYAFGWRVQIEKIELTIRLTQILFPYLLFISLAVLLGAILNTHRVFGPPALSPAILNIFWIVSLVYFGYYWFDAPSVKIMWIAGGVLLGGAGQFLLQVPFYKRLGLRFRSVINVRDPAFREVVRLVLPGVLGMAVTEVNILVDTFLASFLMEGSITALRLANRLMLLPMGIFGVAIATALLPLLSSKAASGDREGVASTYTDAQNLVFFIMLPISFMFIMLAVPIIRVVYEHGNFTSSSSTPLTAFALACYSAGLFAYGGLKITVQAFYSLKDTKTPVKVAIAAMVLNIVLNITLMLTFEKLKPGFGLGGLASATAISAFINLVVLIIILNKRLPGLSVIKQSISFLKIAVLGLVVGIAGLVVYNLVGTLVVSDSLQGQITRVSGAVLGGCIVWFLGSYLLKIKELILLLSLIKRR